jgi:hypothetical protein
MKEKNEAPKLKSEYRKQTVLEVPEIPKRSSTKIKIYKSAIS